jgi:peroxiredoxin Q/BCP
VTGSIHIERAINECWANHSSKSCEGSWLLLYFYPKDDTPGCTIQACGIRDAFDAFAGKITVLGVSKDSTESHKKFIGKYKLPFPLLVDVDRKLIDLFQATDQGFGKRVSFLITPAGVIQNIYTGFDCNVHAAMVLADAQAAGA